MPAIEVVRHADLLPDMTTRSAQWIAGLAGSPDPERTGAAFNARVAIGSTVLEPGHGTPIAPMEITRFYLVTQGQAVVDLQTGSATLARLDGIQFAAGEPIALRNSGQASLSLLWVDCPAA